MYLLHSESLPTLNAYFSGQSYFIERGPKADYSNRSDTVSPS